MRASLEADAQRQRAAAAAAAAEAQALRASQEVSEARLRTPVGPEALRVAGDARGTASTLVGMSPEDELELAMLQSQHQVARSPSVPALPPPPPPPPHAANSMMMGHDSIPLAAIAPLGPLPSMATLAPPPTGPVRKPAHAAASRATARKPKAAAGLRESLIDDSSDTTGLQPLSASTISFHMPTPSLPVPLAAPYQPPSLPAAAPPTPAATSSTRGGGGAAGAADDQDWDDADRPLSAAAADSPASPGSCVSARLLGTEEAQRERRHMRAGGKGRGVKEYSHFDEL
jgi:hypothetical protein